VVPECRPVLVSVVPPVPPTFVNGPDEDVELKRVYHTAPGEAVQDMAIELDDFAVAVTPVGAAGGPGFVIADAGGLDSCDPPPGPHALTT
jgi:hypothetical protein